MIELLIRKLVQRDRLDPDEKEYLAQSFARVESFDARELLVRQGEPLKYSILLLEGFVCRRRDLADGSRMILEIHVPGDFLDLQGFVLKHLEHDVAALTPVRIALVPHTRLVELTERWPHLTRMLWFTTLVDAAIYRERIATIGRRPAIARVAHLFCELHARLDVAQLVDRNSYAFPVVQADIADATGLTPIHVNRMLKKLRDDGVMTFRDGHVQIHDLHRLADIADFDPAFLFLDNQPR